MFGCYKTEFLLLLMFWWILVEGLVLMVLGFDFGGCYPWLVLVF